MSEKVRVEEKKLGEKLIFLLYLLLDS